MKEGNLTKEITTQWIETNEYFTKSSMLHDFGMSQDKIQDVF